MVASLPVVRAVSPYDPVPFEPLPPGTLIETVVPDANQVVAMDFTPDGRLLYTERDSGYDSSVQSEVGYVRVVVNDQLLPDPVYKFPIANQGEQGLLGIAVDPNFASNNWVWVYFTKQTSSGTYDNRIAQFKMDGSLEQTLQSFPVNKWVTIHNGGNLHFGPDGMLYVTVGNNDSTNTSSDPAQALNSPLGKIHRYVPAYYPVNSLGIPTDNPFYNLPGADKSNYAYGLRNSFDFAFDPVSHKIFASENGDACDDEINLILPGGNYGWRPAYPCDDEALNGPDRNYNTLPPLMYWTPTLAPTGLAFYTGNLFPEWKNDLFMCNFKDGTTGLHHFKLNAARTAIISHTVLSDTINHQPLPCRTDVLTGPDGALYFTSGGGASQHNGPILRLTRGTSFALSSVSVAPAAPRSGEVLSYTLYVRHAGTLSNTFALTATLSPSTTFVSADTGLIADVNHVYWSDTLSRTQSITATYEVQINAAITTPFTLTSSIDLTAPNTDPLHFPPAVLINGYAVFLPIILSGY